MKLSIHETRVLGVLMEKGITTPDQYPLSLNGLTTGCNQKTNREPVLSLSEADVQAAIDSLTEKSLVSEVRFGGRVAKYQHRFSGTEFSAFKFNAQQAGILSLLFLRGPQTPGELRTRANRICEFKDVQETEAALSGLMDISGGPFVVRLEREPGRRESRYAHLFCDEAAIKSLVSVSNSGASGTINEPQMTEPVGATVDAELNERVELLELIVEELQNTVADLKTQLDTLS
ncbi:YceH family protein [Teredinibacter franksiae]|jgi:Uncharacterized protein conserved in bacteria|uniref:YceH family protein n=1 Tax=Teredinibacter franksiae TaxID=2761453 RepID=UPI001625A4C3|nr:YceH family protein [Teredinibacter franksiae]